MPTILDSLAKYLLGDEDKKSAEELKKQADEAAQKQEFLKKIAPDITKPRRARIDEIMKQNGSY